MSAKPFWGLTICTLGVSLFALAAISSFYGGAMTSRTILEMQIMPQKVSHAPDLLDYGSLSKTFIANAMREGKAEKTPNAEMWKSLNNNKKDMKVFWAQYSSYCIDEISTKVTKIDSPVIWQDSRLQYCAYIFQKYHHQIATDTTSLARKLRNLGHENPPVFIDRHVRTGLPNLLFMGILGVFIIVCGAGIASNGSWDAAWTNGQKRLSLERLQMIAWTMIIVSAVSTIAFFNAGHFSLGSLTDTSAFPAIPSTMLFLMGISAAAPVLSYFIEKKQSDKSPEREAIIKRAKEVPTVQNALTVSPVALAKNQKPKLSDLFTKHTLDEQAEIDFSQLQNLLLTLVLMGFYITVLYTQMNLMHAEGLAKAAFSSKFPLASLPTVGGSFAGLLLVSHSTYLIVKRSRGAQESSQLKGDE